MIPKEIPGGSTGRIETDLIAIHLSPEGAASLWTGKDGNRAPPALSKLFEAGRAQFKFGLRASAAECSGIREAARDRSKR